MTRSRVIATVSIWLVLCLSLWMTDSQPAVVALAGVVAAGAAFIVVVVDVARQIGEAGWPRPRDAERAGPADPWVTQLHHEMVGARRTGSTVLRDRLVSLVGTDRPMPPTLRAVVEGSPRQLAARRTLERIVGEIEAR